MNNQNNMGKQLKDLGVLFIIVGIIMAILVIYMFVANDPQAPLYILVYKHFFFLVVGSLVSILLGIIIRSIGKSKERKYMQNNPQMYNQQYYPQQNPYNQPQPPYNQQGNNNQ